MARAMRISARGPGRFSSREMVGCEHSAAPSGIRPRASLKAGSCRKAGGVVAVLGARGNHQHPKPQNVGDAMLDTLRCARIGRAGGQAVSDAEAALDLAHRQHAGIRRKLAAVS